MSTEIRPGKTRLVADAYERAYESKMTSASLRHPDGSLTNLYFADNQLVHNFDAEDDICIVVENFDADGNGREVYVLAEEQLDFMVDAIQNYDDDVVFQSLNTIACHTPQLGQPPQLEDMSNRTIEQLMDDVVSGRHPAIKSPEQKGRERIRELLAQPDREDDSKVVLDQYMDREEPLYSDITMKYAEVYGNDGQHRNQMAGRLRCVNTYINPRYGGYLTDTLYDVELTRDELEEFASGDIPCDQYAKTAKVRRAVEAQEQARIRKEAREREQAEAQAQTQRAPRGPMNLVRDACRTLGNALLDIAGEDSPKDERPSFEGRRHEDASLDRTFS